MTGTSVSPDVPPKDEEVVKLNYSFKEACKTNIWLLVLNFIKVLTSVWLFLKYWNSDLPTHRFVLYYISVPLMVCSLTKTICTAFSIFALTQSTVRFLYVDVFYINIFRELVNTSYWTYLLVLIFSPYYFSLSTRVDLTFLAVIFVSLIVQSVLVITYTCSVYFRAKRLQSFLSKFWFVRLLIIIGSGLAAAAYLIYLYFFIYRSYKYIIYILWNLTFAILLMWQLKKEVCLQKTWKLKALDNRNVPDSKYMKQAVSIMKMKEETKKLAEKAATGEA